MAYLEQSTRYVPYTARPDGAWKYHIPAELDGSPLRATFMRTLDHAFETYARWIPAMEAHFRARYPKTDADSDAVYASVIRAKALDTLRGLLRYLRLNINRFVDPGRARFSPYSAADAARWNSNNPVGAMLQNDLGRDWGIFNPEDGSVLCSSYSDTHWIFSTVFTLADQFHPVSGNRQFGCYMIAGPSIDGTPYGGMFIYTRAADRVSGSPLNAQLSGKIFGGGHQTWVSFQARLANYVNAVGGKAAIVPPHSTRYAWAAFAKKHKPTVDWVKGSILDTSGRPSGRL